MEKNIGRKLHNIDLCHEFLDRPKAKAWVAAMKRQICFHQNINVLCIVGHFYRVKKRQPKDGRK